MCAFICRMYVAATIRLVYIFMCVCTYFELKGKFIHFHFKENSLLVRQLLVASFRVTHMSHVTWRIVNFSAEYGCGERDIVAAITTAATFACNIFSFSLLFFCVMLNDWACRSFRFHLLKFSASEQIESNKYRIIRSLHIAFTKGSLCSHCVTQRIYVYTQRTYRTMYAWDFVPTWLSSYFPGTFLCTCMRCDAMRFFSLILRRIKAFGRLSMLHHTYTLSIHMMNMLFSSIWINAPEWMCVWMQICCFHSEEMYICM